MASRRATAPGEPQYTAVESQATPGSAPTPIPAPTVPTQTPAPVTHAPQASGTWSQLDNAAPLGMGPGDLFNLPNFFADFVPAAVDTGRGRGSAGLCASFNFNGLDATLSEPFDFLGEEGFDFQSSGFLPTQDKLEIPASLRPVQGQQSNGVMSGFYGSGKNGYNGFLTAPGPYGFIQNGFSAGPQNYGVSQNIRNEVLILLDNYNVGYQVKNKVSPRANDFVFIQNNKNKILAQPQNNFSQSTNLSRHSTQEAPYTLSYKDEDESQATPFSERSNGYDYVNVEEAGSVNPAEPGNPSPSADNLRQPGMDAIYQQFMNSQGFQRAGPAPTIPASACVPAPRRTPTSAPVSAPAHFLPTTMATPALPVDTAYTAPPPVVATNTSTGTTAPPVPAPILNTPNNLPLTAQTYFPLTNDGILPPNPNASAPAYPAFSNYFATGEAAKKHRKRSRGMAKSQAPDVPRVKLLGRDYWVRRIYNAIIDISNITDGPYSVHRDRIEQGTAFEPRDLEATAHHIFDRAIAVHEIGWNRPTVYYKPAKRGKLVDVTDKSLELRLARICTVLQQKKAAVDDALRGGITLALLCDNPEARGSTKNSNNVGNKKRGRKLKALKEMGVVIPEEPGIPEEPEIPEDFKDSE